MNWEDIIVEAAATDTGMRRSNNQDSWSVVRAPNRDTWQHRGHLFMVADGMGAHAVGELASKLACDNIPHTYRKTKSGVSPAEALTKAYREVGNLIHGKANANKEFQGMGTTCSTLVLYPLGALIAHVGDSRVYRIRGQKIEQLSFDHSLAWELVRRKHMSPQQAVKSVPRNVITRSLGPDPNVEVDIEGPLIVQPSDIYVLCSDGLSGPVSDPEIGTVASHFHPEAASQYLIHMANLRGGNDNITVIVVRVGPWVEPGRDDTETNSRNHSKSSGMGITSLLPGLFSKFKGRSQPSSAEEHVYAASDCTISSELVQDLSDLVRDTQVIAVEQAWQLEWQKLASVRKQAEEERQQGRWREALRNLGEAIVLLGLAGRIHRKENLVT